MLLLLSFPLADLVELFYPNYLFMVAGIRIQPSDFVYFCMIWKIGRYVLLRPRKTARLLRDHIFLAAFVAMIAVYVIICTPIYGQSAVGEARKFYFIFLFPLLALITIKSTEDLRRLMKVLVFVAASVALVALAKTAMSGSVVRVLDSEQTLIIALVALAILVHRVYGMVIVNPVVDKVLLWLFFLLALGSGQRSVWLAFGLGLALTFCLYIRRSVLVSKMLLFAIMMVLGLTTSIILFPQAGSRLVEKFGGIIDPYADDTASWRIQNWQSEWETAKENLFFGDGLGSYYSWKLRGKFEMKVQPHNGYLQMMLKFGLFGLIVYALLVCEFFRETLGIRKKLRPGPLKAYVDLGIITFGATHGYIVGYGLEPISLAFFAIAIAAAKLSQHRFATSRVRTRVIRNDARIVSQGFHPQIPPQVERS